MIRAGMLTCSLGFDWLSRSGDQENSKMGWDGMRGSLTHRIASIMTRFR